MSTPTPGPPASSTPTSSTPASGAPTASASDSETLRATVPAPGSATLSPVSPESGSKLEPLSAAGGDQAALGPDPPQRAPAIPEAGSAAKGPARKSFRWAIWLTALLIFVIVGGVFGLIYLTTGWVSGTEFDAVNWTARDFEFMRDPITETQLTNIKHSSSGFTLDASIAPLITGGPARPALPRWDLVNIYRGMSSGTGEAHILLEYLQASDHQGQNVWVEWTRSHRKAAPIFWAAVRDAVHLERYDRLPEIFDQVRVDDDPKALKAGLAKIMLALARDEARAQAKAGDQAAARRAALVGLSYGHSDELRSLAGGAPSKVAPDATDDAQEDAPRDAKDDAAGDDTQDAADDASADDRQEQ